METIVTKNVNPPATASATMHAERIRARDKARTAEQGEPAAKSTAELYAARILPGYHADEALREEARRNELRARGVWTPGDEELDEVEDEEPEEAPDPLDSAERRSASASWKSASTGGGHLIV